MRVHTFSESNALNTFFMLLRHVTMISFKIFSVFLWIKNQSSFQFLIKFWLNDLNLSTYHIFNLSCHIFYQLTNPFSFKYPSYLFHSIIIISLL